VTAGLPALPDSGAAVPNRFTMRQLEYFVATCDAGSVTEAALSIPVSQSSVSAGVSQLEAALGVQLFVRHHAQSVHPTTAGREFLVRARELLRAASELERFAAELTHELSGLLELGSLVTLAPVIVPSLCRSFLDANPAVRLALVEGGQVELLDRLRDGSLTVALTYDLELAADIDFTPLSTLPPYAVFPGGHPWAGRERVSMTELANEPLVLLDLPHSREYFRSLFVAAGVNPRVAHRSRQPDAIRTMVANGYGYTIINVRPAVDRALDGRPLATVPISGDPRPMQLGIARLATLAPTRVIAGFVDHCRRQLSTADPR
jgi:DNA-binding transcriptional LysR family regulator